MVSGHGSDQVVYPITDLRKQDTDLHKYLRQLESVIIASLSEVSGITAFREEGLTG